MYQYVSQILPISLLIISWSFTKEVEQITLRLYLWVFLIHLSHLQENIKSWEKDSILPQHAEIFISGILKCLLAPTVLESWIFYCTWLKVSQKQVFSNDQPLFKCLTKTRKIKGGRRLPVLPFTLKEVTPDKYLSNLFSRNLYERKGFLNSPYVSPLRVSPS